MHSAYQRINALSSLLSSCLLGLLAVIALTSLAIPHDVKKSTIEISPLKVRFGQSGRFKAPQEWAFLQFDVNSDLRSLFNWNTKQLFVYLAAEYTNSQGITNDVVLWDRIVQREKDAHLKIAGARNKYAFRDYSQSFQNATNVEFSLRYELMPYVGVLTRGEAGRTSDGNTALKFPIATRA